jgi:hypothetical protein
MEELAEAWSLSLDQPFLAEIKARLRDEPRPATEIRDWRTVLEELDRDAEIQD